MAPGLLAATGAADSSPHRSTVTCSTAQLHPPLVTPQLHHSYTTVTPRPVFLPPSARIPPQASLACSE
jgi:hypothetical protein